MKGKTISALARTQGRIIIVKTGTLGSCKWRVYFLLKQTSRDDVRGKNTQC